MPASFPAARSVLPRPRSSPQAPAATLIRSRSPDTNRPKLHWIDLSALLIIASMLTEAIPWRA
jgi:hypothetical protein